VSAVPRKYHVVPVPAREVTPGTVCHEERRGTGGGKGGDVTCVQQNVTTKRFSTKVDTIPPRGGKGEKEEKAEHHQPVSIAAVVIRRYGSSRLKERKNRGRSSSGREKRTPSTTY